MIHTEFKSSVFDTISVPFISISDISSIKSIADTAVFIPVQHFCLPVFFSLNLPGKGYEKRTALTSRRGETDSPGGLLYSKHLREM